MPTFFPATLLLLLALAPAPNPLDEYLRAEVPVADGFDFPLGDAEGSGPYTDGATGKTYRGFRIDTVFGEQYSLGLHPGEDWNGTGGGDTDRGQQVHAIGAGRVVHAAQDGPLWGNVIVIRHQYYANHHRRFLRSVYVHLDELRVVAGDDVARRQIIGTVGKDPEGRYRTHLHLELRRNEELEPTFWPSSQGKDAAWLRANYLPPSGFIRAHRTLFVPQREELLALVDSSAGRMRLLERGSLLREYQVAFGQVDGRKRRRHDNRTPRGMYFVTGKRQGEFPGPFGGYFGGHWVKFNYPNRFDAAWGLRQGLLPASRVLSIAADWQARRPTRQDTELGGGIGFHGWIAEWPVDADRRLSWGCVVLHLADISDFYARIREGAMVVIF